MNNRELDAKMAELMGWYYIREDEDDIDSDGYWTHPTDRSGNSSPPDYPSDISAAWLVVEKMKEISRINITFDGMLWVCQFPDIPDDFTVVCASADTLPEAICKAALKAVEAEIYLSKMQQEGEVK